jgi:hypothetical protein
MPVILATQEGEIRRIKVQKQPGRIVHETLSPKYPRQNRAGGLVEHLSSKHEAQPPRFKPQYYQKKKKKKVQK